MAWLLWAVFVLVVLLYSHAVCAVLGPNRERRSPTVRALTCAACLTAALGDVVLLQAWVLASYVLRAAWNLVIVSWWKVLSSAAKRLGLTVDEPDESIVPPEILAHLEYVVEAEDPTEQLEDVLDTRSYSASLSEPYPRSVADEAPYKTPAKIRESRTPRSYFPSAVRAERLLDGWETGELAGFSREDAGRCDLPLSSYYSHHPVADYQPRSYFPNHQDYTPRPTYSHRPAFPHHPDFAPRQDLPERFEHQEIQESTVPSEGSESSERPERPQRREPSCAEQLVRRLLAAAASRSSHMQQPPPPPPPAAPEAAQTSPPAPPAVRRRWTEWLRGYLENLDTGLTLAEKAGIISVCRAAAMAAGSAASRTLKLDQALSGAPQTISEQDETSTSKQTVEVTTSTTETKIVFDKNQEYEEQVVNVSCLAAYGSQGEPQDTPHAPMKLGEPSPLQIGTSAKEHIMQSSSCQTDGGEPEPSRRVQTPAMEPTPGPSPLSKATPSSRPPSPQKGRAKMGEPGAVAGAAAARAAQGVESAIADGAAAATRQRAARKVAPPPRRALSAPRMAVAPSDAAVDAPAAAAAEAAPAAPQQPKTAARVCKMKREISRSGRQAKSEAKSQSQESHHRKTQQPKALESKESQQLAKKSKLPDTAVQPVKAPKPCCQRPKTPQLEAEPSRTSDGEPRKEPPSPGAAGSFVSARSRSPTRPLTPTQRHRLELEGVAPAGVELRSTVASLSVCAGAEHGPRVPVARRPDADGPVSKSLPAVKERPAAERAAATAAPTTQVAEGPPAIGVTAPAALYDTPRPASPALAPLLEAADAAPAPPRPADNTATVAPSPAAAPEPSEAVAAGAAGAPRVLSTPAVPVCPGGPRPPSASGSAAPGPTGAPLLSIPSAEQYLRRMLSPPISFLPSGGSAARTASVATSSHLLPDGESSPEMLIRRLRDLEKRLDLEERRKKWPQGWGPAWTGTGWSIVPYALLPKGLPLEQASEGPEGRALPLSEDLEKLVRSLPEGVVPGPAGAASKGLPPLSGGVCQVPTLLLRELTSQYCVLTKVTPRVASPADGGSARHSIHALPQFDSGLAPRAVRSSAKTVPFKDSEDDKSTPHTLRILQPEKCLRQMSSSQVTSNLSTDFSDRPLGIANLSEELLDPSKRLAMAEEWNEKIRVKDSSVQLKSPAEVNQTTPTPSEPPREKDQIPERIIYSTETKSMFPKDTSGAMQSGQNEFSRAQPKIEVNESLKALLQIPDLQKAVCQKAGPHRSADMHRRPSLSEEPLQLQDLLSLGIFQEGAQEVPFRLSQRPSRVFNISSDEHSVHCIANSGYPGNQITSFSSPLHMSELNPASTSPTRKERHSASSTSSNTPPIPCPRCNAPKVVYHSPSKPAVPPLPPNFARASLATQLGEFIRRLRLEIQCEAQGASTTLLEAEAAPRPRSKPSATRRASPLPSPRLSPRASPRASPRVSPRASPRTSPRTSPRLSPRLSERRLSRELLGGAEPQRSEGGFARILSALRKSCRDAISAGTFTLLGASGASPRARSAAAREERAGTGAAAGAGAPPAAAASDRPPVEGSWGAAEGPRGDGLSPPTPAQFLSSGPREASASGASRRPERAERAQRAAHAQQQHERRRAERDDRAAPSAEVVIAAGGAFSRRRNAQGKPSHSVCALDSAHSLASDSYSLSSDSGEVPRKLLCVRTESGRVMRVPAGPAGSAERVVSAHLENTAARRAQLAGLRAAEMMLEQLRQLEVVCERGMRSPQGLASHLRALSSDADAALALSRQVRELETSLDELTAKMSIGRHKSKHRPKSQEQHAVVKRLTEALAAPAHVPPAASFSLSLPTPQPPPAPMRAVSVLPVPVAPSPASQSPSGSPTDAETPNPAASLPATPGSSKCPLAPPPPPPPPPAFSPRPMSAWVRRSQRRAQRPLPRRLTPPPPTPPADATRREPASDAPPAPAPAASGAALADAPAPAPEPPAPPPLAPDGAPPPDAQPSKRACKARKKCAARNARAEPPLEDKERAAKEAAELAAAEMLALAGRPFSVPVKMSDAVQLLAPCYLCGEDDDLDEWSCGGGAAGEREPQAHPHRLRRPRPTPLVAHASSSSTTRRLRKGPLVVEELDPPPCAVHRRPARPPTPQPDGAAAPPPRAPRGLRACSRPACGRALGSRNAAAAAAAAAVVAAAAAAAPRSSPTARR